MWCRLVVVLNAVILAGCFLACGGGGSDAGAGGSGTAIEETQAADPSAGNDIDAVIYAQDCVKQHLKYPHDASFGWKDHANLKEDATGRKYWQCVGTVKAANAFGAKLTHDWGAAVCLENHTWTCLLIEIDGEAVYADAEALAERTAALEAQKQAEAAAAAAAEASRLAEERRQEQEILDAAKWRTWTSGTFTCRAKFVKMTLGVVSLEKEDGGTIEIPLEKLAEGDQEFIRNRRWQEAL